MAGPIVFASDGPADDKGPTEYGGRAGLVAGGVGDGEVHPLTGAEKRGLIVRAVGAEVVDPVTGMVRVDESALAVDPVTGIPVEAGVVVEEPTVRPVDAPPKTGDPKSHLL